MYHNYCNMNPIWKKKISLKTRLSQHIDGIIYFYFYVHNQWDIANGFCVRFGKYFDHEIKIKWNVVYDTYLSGWFHLKYFSLLLIVETSGVCVTNGNTQYISIWFARNCKFSKSTRFVHHSLCGLLSAWLHQFLLAFKSKVDVPI